MAKYLKITSLVLALFLFFYCNKKAENKETILKGSTKILVDETVRPIIDDEIAVFQSDYNAKIELQSKSEAEVLQSLFKDSLQIAILSRNLTSVEINYFTNKKIILTQKVMIIILYTYETKRNKARRIYTKRKNKTER